MNKRKKRIFLCLIVCLMGICTNGCGKKLLIDENEKYQLQELTDKDLVNDIYYIKDKTKFYKTYDVSTNKLDNVPLDVSADRIAWFDRDESLIPTLYKDEIIAFASTDAEMDAVTVERLQYNGASIGLYGGFINDEGYYVVDTARGVIKGSQAAEFVDTLNSSDIRIVSVDGKKVTPAMINTAGFFKNLEKGKNYSIELFSGTKYMNVTLCADFYYLQSYELYTIGSAIMTKNGYVSLSMPEGAQSGYYSIKGNIFKYCAFEKGKGDESDVNSNIAFYKDKIEQLAAYSQQYAIKIKTTTEDVTFTVLYDDSNYDKENIKGILQSPDGTLYDMEVETGQAQITLAQAIAGRWVMNIIPKDLPIIKVDAVSSAQGKDAISNTYEFEISEDMTNQRFYAQYVGDGEIWGVVESEDGLSQTMEISTPYQSSTDTEGTIETTFAYLASGKYRMTIYHYENVAVTDTGYGENYENTQQEIITIEE